MQPTTQDIPGTPCLPMTGRYREVYTDWIARGYPHWRAEWEADCAALTAAQAQREKEKQS